MSREFHPLSLTASFPSDGEPEVVADGIYGEPVNLYFGRSDRPPVQSFVPRLTELFSQLHERDIDPQAIRLVRLHYGPEVRGVAVHRSTQKQREEGALRLPLDPQHVAEPKYGDRQRLITQFFRELINAGR